MGQECRTNLQVALQACHHLGVPVATQKTGSHHLPDLPGDPNRLGLLAATVVQHGRTFLRQMIDLSKLATYSTLRDLLDSMKLSLVNSQRYSRRITNLKRLTSTNENRRLVAEATKCKFEGYLAERPCRNLAMAKVPQSMEAAHNNAQSMKPQAVAAEFPQPSEVQPTHRVRDDFPRGGHMQGSGVTNLLPLCEQHTWRVQLDT